jgi:hypothetical protein
MTQALAAAHAERWHAKIAAAKARREAHREAQAAAAAAVVGTGNGAARRARCCVAVRLMCVTWGAFLLVKTAVAKAKSEANAVKKAAATTVRLVLACKCLFTFDVCVHVCVDSRSPSSKNRVCAPTPFERRCWVVIATIGMCSVFVFVCLY